MEVTARAGLKIIMIILLETGIPLLGLHVFLFNRLLHSEEVGSMLKFRYKLGLSFKLSDTELVYDPMNFNIGLIFNIHGKKKSETEP